MNEYTWLGLFLLTLVGALSIFFGTRGSYVLGRRRGMAEAAKIAKQMYYQGDGGALHVAGALESRARELGA